MGKRTEKHVRSTDGERPGGSPAGQQSASDGKANGEAQTGRGRAAHQQDSRRDETEGRAASLSTLRLFSYVV
jgi:hypothetical protein